MNLLEKFNKDIISAMKAQDKDRLAVLRMVKGAMQLESINNKKEVDEELMIDVVSKQIKMRNESITEFDKAGRTELKEQTEKEVIILKEYLPEQLSTDEINKILDEVFAKVNPTGPKDMGLVMKEATPLLKGKADMKEVSNIIKERL